MNKPSFQHIDTDPVEVVVYNNVLMYCKYNDIKIIEGGSYDPTNVKKMIDAKSYIMIKGTVDDNVPYYIFIFGSRSATAGKLAFGNKADDIANVMGHVTEKIAHILYISENSFKFNVIKAITNQRLKKGAEFYIKSVVYTVFKVDIIAAAKRNNGHQYQILNQDEVNKLKADTEKTLSLLPTISAMDVPIIWIMGRRRQVVKITHPSMLSCQTVYYRTIV